MQTSMEAGIRMKDGTYVQPCARSNPDGIKENNYEYTRPKGEIKPISPPSSNFNNSDQSPKSKRTDYGW